MHLINFISDVTSIDKIYLILIVKTIIAVIILEIIKKVVLKFIKNINNSKNEYVLGQYVKYAISIAKFIVFLLIWSKYLGNFFTFITVLSGALTIAIRDLIWNFFTGIYIRTSKPFDIEDRIEINGFKGDVVNLNRLSFEVLEVNNESHTGQSTGVITHLPNSFIFSYPIKNFSKGFNYVWDELSVNLPLDFNIDEAKAIIYRIINTNDIIKDNPTNFKKEINNLSTEYRIFFNNSEPVIYVKVMGDYVEYTIRYLVQPKKARYVNSLIWKELLAAHQSGELILYNKDYSYKEDHSNKNQKKK